MSIRQYEAAKHQDFSWVPTAEAKGEGFHSKPKHEHHHALEGRHHSSLEEVMGEDRTKRRSVSEMVSEEYRKPFTLHDKEDDKVRAARRARAPRPRATADPCPRATRRRRRRPGAQIEGGK